MKNIVFDYIKSDLFRYYGNTSFNNFIIALNFNRGFNFMFWFRIAQSEIFLLSNFAKLMVFLKRRSYKIDIPVQTRIGYGFYIGHGGPLVVNPTTTFGNNCNVSQFTSIGSNKNKAAEIGNNVYIGPNVCIIENVKISDNVTIGAGSVVTKDIPENATVVGNAAKILNYNTPGIFIHNKVKVN